MRRLHGAVAVAGLVFSAAALTLVCAPAQAQGASGSDTRRSGFDFMSPALQTMQRDDAQNPGMLWVKEGAALWQKAAGKSNQSCASCHGAQGAERRRYAAPMSQAPVYVSRRYTRSSAASTRPSMIRSRP